MPTAGNFEKIDVVTSDESEQQFNQYFRTLFEYTRMGERVAKAAGFKSNPFVNDTMRKFLFLQTIRDGEALKVPLELINIHFKAKLFAANPALFITTELASRLAIDGLVQPIQDTDNQLYQTYLWLESERKQMSPGKKALCDQWMAENYMTSGLGEMKLAHYLADVWLNCVNIVHYLVVPDSDKLFFQTIRSSVREFGTELALHDDARRRQLASMSDGLSPLNKMIIDDTDLILPFDFNDVRSWLYPLGEPIVKIIQRTPAQSTTSMPAKNNTTINQSTEFPRFSFTNGLRNLIFSQASACELDPTGGWGCAYDPNNLTELQREVRSSLSTLESAEGNDSLSVGSSEIDGLSNAITRAPVQSAPKPPRFSSSVEYSVGPNGISLGLKFSDNKNIFDYNSTVTFDPTGLVLDFANGKNIVRDNVDAYGKKYFVEIDRVPGHIQEIEITVEDNASGEKLHKKLMLLPWTFNPNNTENKERIQEHIIEFIDRFRSSHFTAAKEKLYSELDVLLAFDTLDLEKAGIKCKEFLVSYANYNGPQKVREIRKNKKDERNNKPKKVKVIETVAEELTARFEHIKTHCVQMEQKELEQYNQDLQKYQQLMKEYNEAVQFSEEIVQFRNAIIDTMNDHVTADSPERSKALEKAVPTYEKLETERQAEIVRAEDCETKLTLLSAGMTEKMRSLNEMIANSHSQSAVLESDVAELEKITAFAEHSMQVLKKIRAPIMREMPDEERIALAEQAKKVKFAKNLASHVLRSYEDHTHPFFYAFAQYGLNGFSQRSLLENSIGFLNPLLSEEVYQEAKALAQNIQGDIQNVKTGYDIISNSYQFLSNPTWLTSYGLGSRLLPLAIQPLHQYYTNRYAMGDAPETYLGTAAQDITRFVHHPHVNFVWQNKEVIGCFVLPTLTSLGFGLSCIDPTGIVLTTTLIALIKVNSDQNHNIIHNAQHALLGSLANRSQFPEAKSKLLAESSKLYSKYTLNLKQHAPIVSELLAFNDKCNDQLIETFCMHTVESRLFINNICHIGKDGTIFTAHKESVPKEAELVGLSFQKGTIRVGLSKKKAVLTNLSEYYRIIDFPARHSLETLKKLSKLLEPMRMVLEENNTSQAEITDYLTSQIDPADKDSLLILRKISERNKVSLAAEQKSTIYCNKLSNIIDRRERGSRSAFSISVTSLVMKAVAYHAAAESMRVNRSSFWSNVPSAPNPLPIRQAASARDLFFKPISQYFTEDTRCISGQFSNVTFF